MHLDHLETEGREEMKVTSVCSEHVPVAVIQDEREPKELLETSENLGTAARPDFPDHEDRTDRQAKKEVSDGHDLVNVVCRETREKLESLERSELLGSMVSSECPVFVVIRETRVSKVSARNLPPRLILNPEPEETVEREEKMDQSDRRVSPQSHSTPSWKRVRKVPPDPKDTEASSEKKVTEFPDSTDGKESSDPWDQKVTSVILVSLDLEEHRVPSPEHCPATSVPLEEPEGRERRVCRVSPVSKVYRDSKDDPEQRVRVAPMDSLVSKVPRDLQEISDVREIVEIQVSWAELAHQDQRDHLEWQKDTILSSIRSQSLYHHVQMDTRRCGTVIPSFTLLVTVNHTHKILGILAHV